MPVIPIGSYPTEREVGRGGTGAVYLGHDMHLERPVAIKGIPESFALDPDRSDERTTT